MFTKRNATPPPKPVIWTPHCVYSNAFHTTLVAVPAADEYLMLGVLPTDLCCLIPHAPVPGAALCSYLDSVAQAVDRPGPQ
jgi:hypothetical protein